MSSPRPKPIINARPLIRRPTKQSTAHLGASLSVPKHLSPSILSTTSTLVRVPPSEASIPIPSTSNVPIPTTPRTAHRARFALPPADVPAAPRTPTNPGSKKSARALVASDEFLPLVPTQSKKSLRQRAFDHAVQSKQGHDPGQVRRKQTKGQCVKEGAFYAFVVLPLSCWYTRAGKCLNADGMALPLPPTPKNVIEDFEDDASSMDSRRPRLVPQISREMESAPKPPISKLSRRVSTDGIVRRRHSMTQMPRPQTPRARRRESVDGRALMGRERAHIIASPHHQIFEYTPTIIKRGSLEKRRASFGSLNGQGYLMAGQRESFEFWREKERERRRETRRPSLGGLWFPGGRL